MFKELKERFDKLSALCDKGIELEEKENDGEDVEEELEDIAIKIALEFMKIQKIVEM